MSNLNTPFVLDLVNTEAGRHILGIKSKDRIVKLSPNSYHLLKDFSNHIQHIEAVFEVQNVIEQKLLPIFETMTFVLEDAFRRKDEQTIQNFYEDKYRAFLHCAGLEKNPQLPQVYLTIYQQNPVAGGGGRDFMNLAGSWAAVRGAATADNTDSASTVLSEKSGTDFRNFRTFTPFNTASIGQGSRLTTGGSSVDYHRNDAFTSFVNTDATSLEIVPTTQASTSALALADYSRLTFASYGSLAFSATANSGYNSITISDNTIISVTGNTLLAVISGRDLSNSAPTGTNSIGSGTLPRLTVNYIPSGGLLSQEI